jgi:phospholipid transport system substrate-binding protein
MRFAGRFAFLLLFLLAVAPAQAQPAKTSPEKAAQFVHELGGKVVTTLGDKNLSDAQLRQQIEALIRDAIDMETIGQSAMGRAWQRATEQQRKDFQEQFAIWATSTYAERLGVNRGGSLTVQGALATANDAYVRTRVAKADGKSATLDFRVRDSGGRLKIVDAEVDGISMDVMQRDEFASVIRRQGIDALIASLRTQVQGLKPVASN